MITLSPFKCFTHTPIQYAAGYGPMPVNRNPYNLYVIPNKQGMFYLVYVGTGSYQYIRPMFKRDFIHS